MSQSVVGMAFANGLLILGVVVMTIGVIGMIRMPDIYTKLHAASKSVFLGVVSLLIAVSASGDPAIVARAILIALLLVVTTPVAAFEIARAATQEEYQGQSKGVSSWEALTSEKPSPQPSPVSGDGVLPSG